MSERIICLTDREAALAAQGKLTALVRVMKPQPVYDPRSGRYEWDAGGQVGYVPIEDAGEFSLFGQPGDVLAAKETFQIYRGCDVVHYKADGGEAMIVWRSPITMPAWAIRRRFTVKSVRAMQVGELIADFSDVPGIAKLPDSQWVWYCELEDKP